MGKYIDDIREKNNMALPLKKRAIKHFSINRSDIKINPNGTCPLPTFHPNVRDKYTYLMRYDREPVALIVRIGSKLEAPLHISVNNKIMINEIRLEILLDILNFFSEKKNSE